MKITKILQNQTPGLLYSIQTVKQIYLSFVTTIATIGIAILAANMNIADLNIGEWIQ